MPFGKVPEDSSGVEGELRLHPIISLKPQRGRDWPLGGIWKFEGVSVCQNDGGQAFTGHVQGRNVLQLAARDRPTASPINIHCSLCGFNMY